MSRLPAEFSLAYDLKEPGALPRANRHRSYWGRLYTDVHIDSDHVVLVFRPSPDARWRPWERVRRGWIFEDLGDVA